MAERRPGETDWLPESATSYHRRHPLRPGFFEASKGVCLRTLGFQIATLDARSNPGKDSAMPGLIETTSVDCNSLDSSGCQTRTPLPAQVPVLIVGGGPTGLLSAYMLSKLGSKLNSLIV